MAGPELRSIRLWQDRIETEVEIAGRGPALVYLHGPWGLNPDRAFIARLAGAHTVYAPRHPGTTPGDPNGGSCAQRLARSHRSIMVNCLIVCSSIARRSSSAIRSAGWLPPNWRRMSPKSVGKLVLIDPVGLWRDDLPVKNWMVLSDTERRPSLFADPKGDAAQQFFAIPSDPDERVDVLAQFVWSQACTGKFVWPVPDRGLKHRIHRIAAPTLIVWGDSDRIIAPDYAKEFAKRIAGARVQMIAKAGHLPQLEQPEAVAKAVLGFLAG